MVTEDYVSYETSKLLKEKGFDCKKESITAMYREDGEFYSLSSSDNYYYDYNDFDEYDYIAPTLQMAMKWLREEKGIAVIPVISSVLDNEKFLWDVKVAVAKTNGTYSQGWVYEKQEDACETAVKYCLENLI